jgi:tetratricopeptide (TPR) repeat protein
VNAQFGQWTSENIGYEIRIARARHDLDLGNTDAARKMLTEAGTLMHNDKRALLNIGLTYARAGLFENAATTLRLALQRDPHYLPALYNLARCLHKLDDPQDALDQVVTLLELEPDNKQFQKLRELTRGNHLLERTISKLASDMLLIY